MKSCDESQLLTNFSLDTHDNSPHNMLYLLIFFIYILIMNDHSGCLNDQNDCSSDQH